MVTMRCEGCQREIFRARLTEKGWLCLECAPYAHIRPVPGSMFPFVTTHLDGHPIEVKSLWHLRQLERQYGVQNFAFNEDEKKWNEPRTGRRQPWPLPRVTD
jgi:hypothetical protein